MQTNYFEAIKTVRVYTRHEKVLGVLLLENCDFFYLLQNPLNI